jgi:glycosyltransferase involved in cell wall biosynthesis
MRTVLLGPKIDLHVGVHDAFANLSGFNFQHRRRDCMHIFVMASEQDKSPFHQFHWGEFVDFGRDQTVVHTARWPALNRRAWVTDTDDFFYPVMCGRHFLNSEFRIAFRQKWSNTLENNFLNRMRNMLTAYAHPSCKSILYRTEAAVREARGWLDATRAGALGELYLSKIQVLYPTYEACSTAAMQGKWGDLGALTVVFCGRDYETKNGRMTLEIFSRLLREFPDTRFVYIGRVPSTEREKYCELVSKIEYHEVLPHERVLAIFNKAHVLFHPSKFEGLGIVFLEAIAAGLAVITATGEAMRHVTELFAEDGALLVHRASVSRHDETASFEEHLRLLLKDPFHAKRMAYSNFNLATTGRFSAGRNREKLSMIYEEALAKPAATPFTLGELPHRCQRTLLRFSSRQVEAQQSMYCSQHDITAVRFLL